MKDNEFTKDFKDEDYLDDEKVEKAIQYQKDKEVITQRKEELKDNEYAKDFKDEDYLNDDKVELAKVKAEKDVLATGKENHNASEENQDEDMNTGETGKGNKITYNEVMASIRQKNSENAPKQKVYTRQK